MRCPRAWMLLVLTGLSATAVAEASAQYRRMGTRGLLGIGASLVRPVGEFQEYVDWGGGLGLYGVVNLDRGRHVGLRFDGGFVTYGHERYTTSFSPVIRRVLVDVTTDNHIFTLGMGPQVTLGGGAIRPYLYGTVGFSYFATISGVSGTVNIDDFASTTNFDDLALALTGGGGLLFRLSRGRHPVSLDLSAQSTYNGRVEYLRRGGIVENPDGSVTLFPIRSQANLVTIRAGIAVGL